MIYLILDINQKISKFILCALIDHLSQDMPSGPIFLWKWALYSQSMAV